MVAKIKVGDLVLPKGAEPYNSGYVAEIEGDMALIHHIDLFQDNFLVKLSGLELLATKEEMDLFRVDQEAGKAAIAAREVLEAQ